MQPRQRIAMNDFSTTKDKGMLKLNYRDQAARNMQQEALVRRQKKLKNSLLGPTSSDPEEEKRNAGRRIFDQFS